MEISNTSIEQLVNINNSIQANILQDIILQDITQNIQIRPDFCITHKNYKPFEPLTATVKQLRKLPVEIQEKYLSSLLQHFIYGIYYSGSLKKHLLLERKTDTTVLEENSENDVHSNSLVVDRDFYDRLHINNNGKGYFDPGWQVVDQCREDKTLIAIKRGLTLHLKYDLTEKVKSTLVANKEVILVKLPKNKVQNGFYVAVGDAGMYAHNSNHDRKNIVRVYFNLTAEGAPPIMNSLTQKLNDAFVPFHFKTLYNPLGYDERCDCAVLYFGKENYDLVKYTLEYVYSKHRAYFQTKVPLFSKLLAPGLGLAEEPNQKFAERESFGQNRCQIIAKSLLEAKIQGNNTSQERMAAINQNFSSLGIDLHHPYLNSNSQDIYTPLEQ